MKVIIYLGRIAKASQLCSLIGAILASTTPTILKGQVTHQVEFSRSDLQITTVTAKDGNTYNKISLADLPQTDELGKPCLPVKHVRLIIPSQQDIDEVVLEQVDKKEMAGHYFVIPVQPDVPTSSYYQEPEFVPPDSSLYESDDPYPSEIVRVVHDGYFDGSNHIATLALYPTQYRPKSGKLTFISSVTISLQLKPSSKVVVSVHYRLERNQRIYDAALAKIVDNPHDLPMYRVRPNAIRSLSKVGARLTGGVAFYEYVLITNNDLKSFFDDFVSWKKRKGIDIGIVTVEEIYGNYSGDLISGIYDDAGKVRQYLSEAYSSGTVWALLAGDHTIVPVRYGDGSNNSDWSDDSYYKIPANLYFADFNGDWEVDHDINLGERYNDSPDYNPEIFVGRVPCTNEQDIKNWVQKIIKYELYPGNGDYSYLTECFWVSADEMINQPDYVSPHYPSVMNHEKWKAPREGNLVVEEMSDNYGILNWYCHGGVNHFATRGSTSPVVWTTDDGKLWQNGVLVQSDVLGDGLDNMANYDYPSVVYSICCQTGAFDDFRSTNTPPPYGQYYPTDQRCMAEGFTCMNSKINGPINLSNTRYGWVSISWQLHREFADLWATGFVDSESGKSSFHAGVAEAVSKQNFNSHYLRYSHNCFGCPETEIWTDVPSAFSNVVLTLSPSSIMVNAGVTNVTITVCSDDLSSFWETRESASGTETFSTSLRPLYVTVTNQDYIPYVAITGGTITCNQTWAEKLFVHGDITVPTAKTLAIRSGTTLIFAANSDDQNGGYSTSKSELVVNGTLQSEGVTFASSASNPGDWYGIVFNNSNSGSYIRSSTVENGTNGIYCVGCDPTIGEGGKGNTIQYNCGNGIRCYEASPDISHNVIQHNGVGIFCDKDSHPDICQNYVTDNNSYGIYCIQTDQPWIRHNEISNNSSGGIVCLVGSSPQLIGKDGSEPYGANRIVSNTGNGVMAFTNSNPNLGFKFGYQAGYSDIYGNSAKQVANYTGITIRAWRNWWGTANPGTQLFTGPVDYSSPLSSPSPYAGPTWGISKASSFFVSHGHSELDKCLEEAQLLEGAGRYEEAVAAYRFVVDNYGHTEYGTFALARLMACRVKQEEVAAERSYLASVAETYRAGELERMIQLWQPLVEARAGNGELAIEMCANLIHSYSGSRLARDAWFEMGMIQLHELGDCEAAQQTFEEFAQAYPGDPLVEHIEIVLANCRAFEPSLPKPGRPGMADADLPTDYVLSENYPNPFSAAGGSLPAGWQAGASGGNPVTTIEFSLPEAVGVQLVVFNLLGQRVRTLVDERKEAGVHQALWDSRDETGMQLPAGIYLCRMVAGEFVKSIKMALVR